MTNLKVFLLPSIVLACSLSVSMATNRKLMVLLIDGFRWDYFDLFEEGELKGFEELIRGGVKAEYITPEFPTLSFTNFYSLMTGLHPESHGFVNNYMYDEKHDSVFLIGDNRPEQDQPFWWDDGEPLWITAAKQGKRSHMWYWNGCEVEIRGYRPAFCAAYQDDPNPDFDLFSAAVHEALERLENDAMDFAGVYFEKIDHYGHQDGPGSDKVIENIRLLDGLLVEVLSEIKEKEIGKNLDIILFSDHGMSRLVDESAVINLLDYINASQIYKAINSKDVPVIQLWPVEGQTISVYESLRYAHPNVTVYLREDIPHQYYLKSHYRNPPIFLVADEGYSLFNINQTQRRYWGYHGYDNMIVNQRAMFLATGPDFKENHVQPGFNNIEIYNLMCCILGLEPSPNNGTLSNIESMLNPDDNCLYTSNSNAVSLSIMTLIVCFLTMSLILL